MSKKYLIKRLAWYYPMEKMHAFITFPLISMYLIFKNSLSDIIFLLYGLVVCIFILFQGQHYWKLKLNRLTNKPFDQKKNLMFFSKSKTANLILISFMPIMFIFQLYLHAWAIKTDKILLWGILANVFGILEHINYYNKQLMVDNAADLGYLLRNRKLKTASLAKDLSDNSI